MEGVRLRPRRARPVGAGRPEPGAAARRELHEQLEDAPAARVGGGDEMGVEMDGVGAGRAALVELLRVMHVFGPVRDGIRRVNKAPAILVGVWLMTLAVSVP